MTRKCHNHIPQTDALHHEKEAQNTDKRQQQENKCNMWDCHVQIPTIVLIKTSNACMEKLLRNHAAHKTSKWEWQGNASIIYCRPTHSTTRIRHTDSTLIDVINRKVNTIYDCQVQTLTNVMIIKGPPAQSGSVKTLGFSKSIRRTVLQV